MKKFERLHTNILGIEMNAPVLTASGTFVRNLRISWTCLFWAELW